jgi:pyruvate,orthophosphate dikinase
MAEQKVKLGYLAGTGIEVPRGALTAGEIAQTSGFFSFGTDDSPRLDSALGEPSKAAGGSPTLYEQAAKVQDDFVAEQDAPAHREAFRCELVVEVGWPAILVG